jgi:hypothetical protein
MTDGKVTAKDIMTINPDRIKRIDKELLDRDCVMLDGNCDCPRLEGKSFPECRRYKP